MAILVNKLNVSLSFRPKEYTFLQFKKNDLFKRNGTTTEIRKSSFRL
jgi:hypothetical protein